MVQEGTIILLAEDDLTLSEMYEERLKSEGYGVVHAKDGEEALSMAESVRPSAIVLDIMMPKLNGVDVLKQLKASEETKNIPIIVVTALIQEITKIKELLGPKDVYLVKSDIMPGEVIDQIKRALENKKNNI